MIEVTCVNCGKSFMKKAAEVKRRPVHCCSRQCSMQQLRIKSANYHDAWRTSKLPGLTQQALHGQLHYDKSTGVFTRLAKAHSSNSICGKEAGFTDPAGYVRISVLGKQYKAHRLAWLYVTGEWPAEEIDHINGIRSDNRWGNLRDVSKRVNQQNRRCAREGTATGLLGVSRDLKSNTHVARITVDGQLKTIGHFKTAESAYAAYVDAKRIYHEGNTL